MYTKKTTLFTISLLLIFPSIHHASSQIIGSTLLVASSLYKSTTEDKEQGNPEPIQIFCRSYVANKRQNTVLDADPTDTLYSVMEQIYQKIGVRTCQQVLKFKGKKLDKVQKTLEQYHITSQKTLYLSLAFLTGASNEWSKNGINKYTHTTCDIQGFSQAVCKLDEETIFSHILANYQRKHNCQIYLPKNLKTLIHEFFIDEEWTIHYLNKITGTRYNKGGWNKNGLNKYTGTNYDREGFNSEGYNVVGFDRDGNKSTMV